MRLMSASAFSMMAAFTSSYAQQQIKNSCRSSQQLAILGLSRSTQWAGQKPWRNTASMRESDRGICGQSYA